MAKATNKAAGDLKIVWGDDLERQWHSKQKISKHRDGSLTLSFPSPSLYEAKRWVLQWGKNARVIEPEDLRRQTKGEIAPMAQCIASVGIGLSAMMASYLNGGKSHVEATSPETLT